MKNIAIFFGGKSTEHDVSIITGVLVANGLDQSKYNAVPIYVAKDGSFYFGEVLRDISVYKSIDLSLLKNVTFMPNDNRLYEVKKGKLKPLFAIACAINCMHGMRGEDGSLAGYLKMVGVPLASPDMMPSSIAQDKIATKIMLKGLNIPCLDYCVVKSEKDCTLNLPVIIKPANLGSSIGITVVREKGRLSGAISEALKYDEKVIAEDFLEGFTEINCAVYRSENMIRVSPCEKPFSKGEMLSFNDKYVEGDREFPAVIKEKIAKKIQGYAKKVYENLFFDGVIRIDFLVKDDKVYLNEINAVPGSMAYYLFCEDLNSFYQMLNEIISVALVKFNKKETLISTFDSSVLKIDCAKGGKRL